MSACRHALLKCVVRSHEHVDSAKIPTAHASCILFCTHAQCEVPHPPHGACMPEGCTGPEKTLHAPEPARPRTPGAFAPRSSPERSRRSVPHKVQIQGTARVEGPALPGVALPCYAAFPCPLGGAFWVFCNFSMPQSLHMRNKL